MAFVTQGLRANQDRRGHFVSGLVVGALTCAVTVEGMLFWTMYRMRSVSRNNATMITMFPTSALFRVSVFTVFALASVG